MTGARSVVVGVAGGTGSGKSTVVSRVVERLGPDRAEVIHHDAYYRDLGHLPPAAREEVNFDHPGALDTPLLVAHLAALERGEAVEVPIYDFATHTRRRETRLVRPAPVLLVDGILVLAEAELRERMDLRLYVDTPADLRAIRRIRRDMEERGRTLESVVAQYEASVRPMHLEFVEPSLRFADLVIREVGHDAAAIDRVVDELLPLIGRRA